MIDTLHDSAGSHVSNTLTITTLEDLRGGECSFSTDPTVINQAFHDFSGDPSVKLELSQDPTCEGLIMTLTDSCEQPVTSASQLHSNRIGHYERDEEGWTWYSSGYNGISNLYRYI